MILGSRTAEQMFASAKTMNQRCEAEFYLGEWQLKNGGPEKAAEHFKSVLRICPLDFIEHKGAVAELNRLTQ
jgi:rhomboid protease GluP